MADIKQIARAIKTIKKNKAKNNYYDYVQYVNPEYDKSNYGEYICDIIQKAINDRDLMLEGKLERKNQYIMLSMPPRHGKSFTVTETLPSYFMGKYPKSKVILTAYSSTLAYDFAGENAKKVLGYNVFGNIGIKKDNQDRMVLSNDSQMVKAGILGGITGKGANLLIIDDPIKTDEEAQSENHRNKIWQEWEKSLSTRLENCAIVILIMTRWHEDDLAGRLLNPKIADTLDWKVINLPMEAEENDILGRKIGEPLWPKQYGYNFILERKKYTRTFNTLYQGRPTSQEGNILKRKSWQYYDYRIEFIRTLPIVILTVDATFKKTEDSDKVSIQVWGKKGPFVYMIDNKTCRMGFSATIKAIENMLKKYPMISAKYVEDKANGPAIIEMMNQRLGGFIPVPADVSTGGKIARVNAIEPFVTSENVYLPRGHEWVDDFIEECASFPNGKHDDQVDAMSMALNKMYYYYADVERLKIPPSENNFEEEEPKNFANVEYSDKFMNSF